MPLIFLSHTSRDRRLADELHQWLRDAFELTSDDVFYSSDDRTGVAAGAPIDPEVESALKESRLFVAVVTTNYVTAPWPMCEAGAAWAANADALFPIAVQPVGAKDLPAIFASRKAHFLDGTEAALNAIEADVGKRLGRQSRRPLRDRAERLEAARATDAQFRPLRIIEQVNFDRAYPDDAGNLVPLDDATVEELERIRASPDVFEPPRFLRWDLANHYTYASDRPRSPFVLKVVAFEGRAETPDVRLVSHALTSAQDPGAIPAAHGAPPRVFTRASTGWKLLGDDEVFWHEAPGHAPGNRVLEGILSADVVGRRLRMVTAAYVPDIFSFPDRTVFFSLSTHRAVARSGQTRYLLFRHPESRGRYVRQLFCFATGSGLELIEHGPYETRWARPPAGITLEKAFVREAASAMLKSVAGDAATEVVAAVSQMFSDEPADCQFWVDNARDGVAQNDGPGLRQRRLMVFFKRPGEARPEPGTHPADASGAAAVRSPARRRRRRPTPRSR